MKFKIVSSLFMVCLLALSSASAAEEQKIEAAIRHVIEDGIPKYRVMPNRNHSLIKSDVRMRELSTAISSASAKWSIPPMLLVAIAFRENSFKGHLVGKLGERSTFQIIPTMVRSIQHGQFPWSRIAEPECDLKTMHGAALCAAALLAIHLDRCGDLDGSLALYATGRTCKEDTERLKWLVGDRLGISEYLEQRYNGVE